MAIAETDTEVHTPFEQDFEKDVAATQRYFDSSRFAGIIRLYTARQVVEQRGTIPVDHIVARGGGRLLRASARTLCSPQEHHDVWPLLAGAGGEHEADGYRGDLPRWLGYLS